MAANTLWVAGGTSVKDAGGSTKGLIATSTDGINWTGRNTNVFNSYVKDVKYGNGLWVALGYSGYNEGNSVATSTDGLTWTGRGTIFARTPGSVAYGNGLWVAVGYPENIPSGNTILTSTNGINWTGRSTQSSGVFSIYGTAVAYGKDASNNNLWVAVGSSGNSIATSTNGITWTGRGSTVISNGWCIAYGNGLWIAGGDGRVATSTDGITWTARVSSALDRVTGVIYANNLWVAINSYTGLSQTTIATSIDGITWTSRNTKSGVFNSNVYPQNIAYGNNLWVASGQFSGWVGDMINANTIATSIDGINWTGRGSTVFSGCNGLSAPTVSVTVLTNFSFPLKNIGDSPFTITPPTTNNNAGALTYTSSNTAVATIDGNTMTIVGMGTSTITVTQASTETSTSATTTATLTVENVKPVITNFSAITKTFGDASFSIVAPTSNSTGAFTYTSSNTAVATIVGTTITIVSAGTSTITASQAITADYGSAIITTTLTVNKATAVLTNFSEITKTFGNAAFNLVAPTSNSTGTFTYTSSNTAVATIAGSTVTIVGGGTATITASQATTTNYLAETITATMTVSQATPTITNFSVPAKVLENAPFTIVNPTSNSSGAFTYTSSDTLVATIEGNVVTIVGKGTSTITASQASTTNYLAGSITATFIVRLTPVITNFSAITKTFGDASFSIVAPTTDSDGAFTYTSSNTAVATVSGTAITIVSAGTSTITATQSITSNYASGTITTTLTVNKATPVLSNFFEITRTFGDAAFTISRPTSSSDSSSLLISYQMEGNVTNLGSDPSLNGTLVGTASYNSSVFKRGNQSLLSNLSSYISIPTVSLNNTSGLTIAFWFYRTAAGTEIFAFFNNGASTQSSFQINSHGNGTIYNMYFGFANWQTNLFYTYPSINVWNHFAVTLTYSANNTSIHKVYADGVLRSTISNLPYPTFASSNNRVGQIQGYMDDFRIYQKVLTDADITNVYNNTALSTDALLTYSSSNTAVATITGSTVSIVGGGTATITASQATTTNYLSETTTATMTVSQATPTITKFDVPAKALGTAPFSLVAPITNSSGAFTYTSSDTSVATMDGSTVTIVGLGNTTITAVQASTANYLSGSITGILSIMVNVPLSIAVGSGGNSIATSTDLGLTWTGRGTQFSTSGYGVAGPATYDVSTVTLGLYVAVGGGTNNIITSFDGITWTQRSNTFFSSTINSIDFSNGLFVVGWDNGISTSTNGFSWTTRNTTPTKCVKYANNLWVAVGSRILTSTDGITWINCGTYMTEGCGVAYGKDGLGNDLWIVCGYNSGINSNDFNIATSSNGTTWTGSRLNHMTSYRCVAYANGIWVIGGFGTSNTIIASNNGSNWSGCGLTLSRVCYGIAYGNNLWVAVGGSSGPYGKTQATSTNGFGWVGQESPIWTDGDEGHFSGYFNNKWFVGGTRYTNGGTGIATSTNGSTWIRYEYNSGTIINSITCANLTYTKPTYVAAGVGVNTLVGSTDGTTWSASLNTPFTTAGYGVAWNGTQWVAVGSGGNTIAYSADGLQWTGNSTFSTQGNDVAYGKDSSGNGLWVVTGQGGNNIATSTNGQTWTGRTGTTIFTTGGWCVAFGKDGSGNNLLVAVGQGGNTIATSTNGTTWTGRGATVFTTQGIGVTYANNLWIAVGSGGNSIATSTNGTTWTGLGTSVFTQGNGIRYTNNLWVATGQGDANTIATSVNGTTWVGRGSTVFSTAGQDVLGPTTAEPTIIFTIPLKNIGDAPFTMVPPTSNSTGLITYTSSNTEVATIDGSTMTIVGMGTSTITAFQESTDYFISGTTTTTLTVENVKPVVTDFAVPEKTFGDAAFSIVAPTSNSDGAFTYTSSNTAVATVAGSTITIVGAGTSTITAYQAITADYGSAIITATFTVNKATPTITNFSAITKTFGNAAFSLVAPTSNSAGAFTYSSSNTAVATIAGSTATIVGGGTATITASQATTTNYLSETITATMTVSQATPTITNFSVPAKVLENAPFTIVNPTSNSSGAFTYTSSDTSVATIEGNVMTIVGKGTSTITASQASTTNYLSGSITATFIVRLTPVITNFSAITKTFGDASFSIVAPTTDSDGAITYTSSNTAVATVAGSTITIVSAGTSTITATQSLTSNYVSGTITATLTVNKAIPTITNFSAITKTFGNAAFSLVAPSSNSTGAFTYTSSNTAVATIAGSTVSIVGGGTVTITASQATTTNYLAGTTTATLTVNKATTVLSNFSAITKTFGNAAFSITQPTSNSAGPFTYTSSNTAVATIAGSTVTIVGAGTATITASQETTTNHLAGTISATMTVSQATPTITIFDVPAKAIGTAPFTLVNPTSNSSGAFTYTSSNTSVATMDGSMVTIVGLGNTTITAVQASTTNYLSGSITGILAIMVNVPLSIAVGQGGNSIATSIDRGLTWTGRTGTTVFTTSGSCVAFGKDGSGNNLLVAVGEGGNTIATSTNGTTWIGRGASVFTTQGIGVAYANNLWVAVGKGTNSIATSMDGTVWTGRTGTSIFSNQGIGVAFNNGLWVAVGQGTNSIATSPDGVVWTGRTGTSIFSNQGIGVAFNNGLWVAVGDGTSNSIATSTNGTVWTGRGKTALSGWGRSVAYGNGLWVAAGQGTNSIATSTDGVVWTGRTGTSIFSNQGISVAFNSGVWIAVGQGTNTIATSTDGVNWIGRGTSIFSTSGFGVAVGIITPPNVTGVSPSSGAIVGGTSVTITGTNFTGATSVTFDGLAATTINVVNSTTITCITPARSAGAVGIIVTTEDGPSGEFSSYTYITPPSITGISPLSGSTEGGTSVTITGTSFIGVTSITFGGLAATTINVVNSTTITCITPARSVGAIGIIVTTGGGPSGPFSSYTYILPPSITDISPSSGGIAGGTSVTITGTNFTGATSVTFGISSATAINVVNSTTITCITPARSAGAVGIIVTTGGGPSSAFSSYTYISPPNITSISPSSGSTLGGTSVTLTGTSFIGANLVTFGGLTATSLNVVNSTTITCITPVRSTGAVGIIVRTIYGTSVAFSSYTYITPPVISRISPSFGGIAGGTNVTITGKNFTGATLVTLGGLAATSLSIVNSTTITCITPADSAGAAGIIVTTGGGPSVAFSSFTYITPPVISSISPSSGSTAGGTSVTITGTNFTGATSVTFDGLAATTINVVNSTTITCITPAHISEGVVDIIVTNGGGPSDAFSSFAYITPPVISSISSSSGSTLGGTNATITGTNFTGATLVTFGGLAATSLSVVNSTTITCITPARTSAGAVGIIVTTGGGPSSAFSSFTYILPPVISSISPSSGSTAGETNVTITGTNFTGATSVTFDGLAATSLSVVNSTTITCITPSHSVGAVGIIVTTGGGSSGAFSSYTYITSSVISSISPSSGGIAGGTSVTITGINFTGATSVTFDGIAATTINVVNSTTITCITPAVDSAGAVGIIVTNGGGPSDAFSSYTYITPPSITDISPSSGINTGGTSVTITGTNFTGATLVTFGGVAATSLSIVDSTTITCITPAVDSDGAVGIIVTTEGGPSYEFLPFTYITSPVISSILPSSGSTVGETSVTITGMNFTGATSVTFDGLSATYLSVVDSTTITCITPARTTAGAVGIIVTAEGGPSSEFSSYTYITPPNITEISPSSGSTLGGTNATITGTNFTGATSVTFDDLAATTINVVDSTTITCITPAHDAGDVVIVVTTEGGPSDAFSSYTYITPPSIIDISPSSGSTAGGTSVTITGMSFTEATSVTFDGLAATSLSIVDSTTITCSTPAHDAGDVDIIVTTIYGTSDAFSQFTYITPPNITDISPSSGSTLGGTNATITGTNFTGATSVTFDGLDATNINVVDNTTITCITPAHNAGAVGIIVITDGGPSGEFSSYTYTTPPNITSISPSTGSTAGGTSVAITGTSFTGETSVTFDGLAATTINVVNSTTITCITPAHNAGAVGIIVTSEGIPSGEFSSFTYITPPNITGILPSSGSTLGGTSVAITGTNFTGATSVTFDGLAATTINVVNSTTITCITPAHSSGAVGIIVTTGGGPSSEFSSFTYITSPNITGISPLTGSTAGGTSVAITGTSFTGATLVTFGGVAATSLSIVDSTTITCITPARATAGAVGVIVTTGGGPSGAFASFTYILPPNIKSMTPSSVSRVGGTTVTITGTNFIGATSVTFGGLNATSFNVVNNTSITCITPARTTGGTVGVIVTTGGGPSGAFSTFIYVPFVSAILPTFGTQSGGTAVKITGIAFTGATSVTFGGIAATNVFVFNPTTITCRTPAGIAAGAVGVIVSTGHGPSNTFSSFTYITPPNITGISPSYGGTVGGSIVTITGKSFTGVSSVLFGGLKVKSLRVIDDTTITCVTAARTTPGPVNITVQNSIGISNVFSSFTYIITPTIKSISPNFGSTTGGNTVTVTGTDFTGATEVTVGDISCATITVIDNNTLTCITPVRTLPGPVGIIVTTGGGSTKKSSPFTYILPPVITSISPSNGGTTGGNVVTITGLNFKGATSVTFGGLNATLVKAVNDTTITCKTPVSITAGAVDVIVRTGGGPSGAFSSYTYITPPVISAILPPDGSILGGNIVTITGTNLTGATSVLFGKAASTNITVVDDTTLTCRTPLNKSGASGVIVRTGGGPSNTFASFTFVTPASISGVLPLSGSTNGGTFVTIKGKDFIGATSVTIGGVEATSFTVVNATIITCITPARIGAGGVGIIVTTAGGASKQFSFFNYITPPVITSLSPSSGSTLGGTSVAITGTNFTGASSVTINGTAATPIKVVDNTTITCKAPVSLSAGPVDVIVTTGGGPSSAFSSYTYITPAVITSISPAFGPKAGGTSVTITGTNFTGASVVLFGLKSATNINVVDNTTITCVTPDSTNPIAVGITLTTGAGLSNKFSSFTYR